MDDSSGQLAANQDVAKRFVSAEDRGELVDMIQLMGPTAHFGSFWGVARGVHASLAVHRHERQKLGLSWTTDVKALTSKTFYREGYVDVFDPPRAWGVPIFSRLYQKLFQKRVRESLVVRDGKVIFRHLGYDWGLARW